LGQGSIDHVQNFLNFRVSEIWYHLVEMDPGRAMVYCKWPDHFQFSRYLDLFLSFAWIFLMTLVEKNQIQKFFEFSFSLIFMSDERGRYNSINDPIEKTILSFVSKIWIFNNRFLCWTIFLKKLTLYQPSLIWEKSEGQ